MARKILLADDSAAVQKAVEATLKQEDFELLSAASGNQAIEQAKMVKPDIILLDSDLPEGDGYETCRRMKEDFELANIPVIVLTSEGGESLAREAGAEGHLLKPFQSNVLLERVSELLAWPVEEEPDKTDTTEMDVTGLGLDDDELAGEFELDDLEVEDEDVLELTEELDPVDVDESREAAGADTEELNLEEGIEWSGSGSDAEEPEEIKPEEMEDFDLEAELEDFDLGELEWEGTEEVSPLGEDLPEERLDSGQGPADTEVLESASGVEEEFDLGDLDLTSELDLFDSSDEEVGVPETEQGAAQDEEAALLHETGLGISEDKEPMLRETDEEEVVEERRIEEDVPFEEEVLTLDETSLQWEHMPEAVEGAEPQEEPSDTNIQELQGVSSDEEGLESFVEASEPAEGQPDQRIELTEEVALEHELSSMAEEQAAPSSTGPIEFEELPIEAIPSLEHGLRMELTEEDFGVIDPFSEEGIRKQLSKNIQEMVERILSDMAPSIIERVAREIALEKAERIVLEEIERLRPQPEGH